MANDFLFRIPVMGWLLPFYGAFPVIRGRLDREALRRAEQHLEDGDLVCIFPEGGTSITGRLVPFEGGVALLALRRGVPIVPLAVTGTDRVLSSSNPVPRFARGGVTVRFGPTIDPADIAPDCPRRDRIEAITQRIYDAVASLLPPEYLPEAGLCAPAAPEPVPDP
jgi:1-acyl-sn-glycerol-3-phosphate acyltransferase